MGPLYTFFIRIILSIGLAFIIIRFFFQSTSAVKILGLAAIMFALAYLFEYTRRKDKEEKNGT